MLGYGFVNSSIHDLCLTEIIFSFLSRSSIFLSPYYFNLYGEYQSSGNTLPDDRIDIIIKLFFEEERILYKRNLLKQGVLETEIDTEDLIYRYILSANIINNQNYNYQQKDLNKLLEDGIISLRAIFLRVLENFFSFLEESSPKEKIFIPDLPISSSSPTDRFIVDLIKYSTFIFENDSVVASQIPGQKSISNIGLNSFYFPSPNPDFSPDKGSWMMNARSLFVGVGGKELQDELTTYKINGSEENPCSLKELPNYNYFSTGGKFLNYGRPKYNGTPNVAESLNVSPFLFGEFFYKIKQENLNELLEKYVYTSDNVRDPSKNPFYFIQYALSEINFIVKENLKKFEFFQEDDIDYKFEIDKYEKISEINDNSFDTFKYQFTYKTKNSNPIITISDPISELDSDNRIKLNGKTNQFSFLIDKNSQLEIKQLWQGNSKYSDVSKAFIIDINNINQYLNGSFLLNKGTSIGTFFNDDYEYKTYYKITQLFNPSKTNKKTEFIYKNFKSISRGEIFKYYNFSFRELKNIVDSLRKNNESIEKYFDLHFRIMLNLNADITYKDFLIPKKGSLTFSSAFENHYTYKLFNGPYTQGDILNEYPPFYKNIVFNALDGNSNNFGLFLEGKFYVDINIKNKPENASILENTTTNTYSFLSSQTQNPNKKINNFYDPNDNELIKTMLKKEGVVFTPDFILSIDSDKKSKFSTFIQNPTYKCPTSGSTSPILGILAQDVLSTLKINYLLTLSEIKIDTQSNLSTTSDIYFSKEDDPRDSLFKIKSNHYQTALNQITQELSTNKKLSSIINNILYDNLYKESLFDITEIVSNYLTDIKTNESKIINFYEKPVSQNEQGITILTPRKISLDILEQQIRVLENG